MRPARIKLAEQPGWGWTASCRCGWYASAWEADSAAARAAVERQAQEHAEEVKESPLGGADEEPSPLP